MLQTSDEMAHDIARREKQLRFAKWAAGLLWFAFLAAMGTSRFVESELHSSAGAFLAYAVFQCAAVFTVGALVRSRLLKDLWAQAAVASCEAAMRDKPVPNQQQETLAASLMHNAGIRDDQASVDLDALMTQLRKHERRARSVRWTTWGLWLLCLAIFVAGAVAETRDREAALPFMVAFLILLAVAVACTVFTLLRWRGVADRRLAARIARLKTLVGASEDHG